MKKLNNKIKKSNKNNRIELGKPIITISYDEYWNPVGCIRVGRSE